MSRSPYAVTSALVVACPGARNVVGHGCTERRTVRFRKRVHPPAAVWPTNNAREKLIRREQNETDQSQVRRCV